MTTWTADLDPSDPDNYWIDQATGERVNATTGERGSAADHLKCLTCGYPCLILEVVGCDRANCPQRGGRDSDRG